MCGEEITTKCVVLGDHGVGKTCLLMSYVTKEFPRESVPKVLEKCSKWENISSREYMLDLFDSPSEEIPRFYPFVFLVCFSVVNRSSFEYVEKIAHQFKKTPFILVGTQIDLRAEELTKNKLGPISPKEGKKLAKKLKAVKYVECSALAKIGLKNVFEEAITAAHTLPEEYKKKAECRIL
jgi:cell division control protein 42